MHLINFDVKLVSEELSRNSLSIKQLEGSVKGLEATKQRANKQLGKSPSKH